MMPSYSNLGVKPSTAARHLGGPNLRDVLADLDFQSLGMPGLPRSAVKQRCETVSQSVSLI